MVLILNVEADLCFAAGEITFVDAFGGAFTSFKAINRSGDVIAGYAELPNGVIEAFRLNDRGILGLRSLGGSESQALGVSGDGKFIVGFAELASGASHAFRFDDNSGMVDLGVFPGGNFTLARSANSDGSVIVGLGTVPGPGRLSLAFRWTPLTGLVPLGTLPGGGSSEATSVNDNGDIIVGFAVDASGNQRAFRWQSGVFLDLGSFGATSRADAISGDGNVIVGSTATASGQSAFRWTQADGLQSLETSGGSFINSALAVNMDGSVIVGSRNDTTQRAFRWTQETGMITVEDWLRANGVDVASDVTLVANGVSGDGNIVIGDTITGEGYIARVVPPIPPTPPTPPIPPKPPTPNPLIPPNPSNPSSDMNVIDDYSELEESAPILGSGLLVLNDFDQSLLVMKSAPNIVMNLNSLILHGGHGHPLANRICDGNYNVWVSGDWGKGPNAHQNVTIGEINGGYLFKEGIQGNLSFGKTHAKEGIASSKLNSNGIYLLGEMLFHVRGKLWSTLSGFYHYANLGLKRSYLNAGFTDRSHGKTHTRSPGGRFRLDWDQALCWSRMSITPYGEISYVRGKINKFREKAGAFPAGFNKWSSHSTQARMGVNNVIAFERLNFIIGVEVVHQFERESSIIDGQLLGLFRFSLPGEKLKQNWIHATVGTEGLIGSGKATLYLNAATKGQTPTLWLNAMYHFF